MDHKKKCAKCKYSKRFNSYKTVNGENIYCDYLLMTLSRRPCPAENCTVFEPKKRGENK